MDHRARIVIAANRGPVAFVRDDDGAVVERRGVGGLVTAVGSAVKDRPATWVASAITADDRERAGRALRSSDLLVRFIAHDETAYDRYYNGFANRILWFLSHDLWEQPPVFGDEEEQMWQAYRAVNDAFADAMVAEAGGEAMFLPQDYHLALVPGALRARGARPVSLFWHIPFCSPEQLAVLPRAWAEDLLRGLLGADLLAFHVDRWVRRFQACCESVLGARVDDGTVTLDGHTTQVRAIPIGVDVAALREAAGAARVERLVHDLDEQTAGRALLLRADRTEPSKNILRGLQAFESLLDRRPDLARATWHLVSLTPSRRGVPEYQAYIRSVEQVAARIRARHGDDVLTLAIEDDFDATLAAFRRYDVLLVNSVADGMNLVAREGPVLNERDGVLVLSSAAGAADELGDAALLVDPLDIEGTAAALERALDMPAAERAERADRLRKAAPGLDPASWLGEQIGALAALTTR